MVPCGVNDRFGLGSQLLEPRARPALDDRVAGRTDDQEPASQMRQMFGRLETGTPDLADLGAALSLRQRV